MKKFLRVWKQTSKKLRFLLYLLINVLLITAIYTYVSAPAFTSEILFRRHEKASLVGPSEILGIYERDFSEYDRFLLADAGDGVIIFAESLHTQERPKLIYREKTGAVTVLAAPDTLPFDTDGYEARMTIFAFDSCPEAVSARLELTLYTKTGASNFQQTYRLDAQRQIPGVFSFDMHVMRLHPLGAEGNAMEILKLISGYSGANYYGYEFPATVSFYDSDGNLLARESTVIASPATFFSP